MVNLTTKFEVSAFTRYGNMKGVKNAQNGGVLGVVRGHPSSSAMSPFSRAHTISYLSLIETMPLYCTVFELLVEIRQLRPILPAFGAPVGGMTPFEFRKDFWHQKTRVPGRCLCHPTFSRFSRTLTCDRQTHRQTDRHKHRAVAYTAQSIACAVKMVWIGCYSLHGI